MSSLLDIWGCFSTKLWSEHAPARNFVLVALAKHTEGRNNDNLG